MNSFDYFLKITTIPRPSHKEEKIAQYLIDFAKSHNLSYQTDKFNNVIIFKDNGSPKTVALQAHLDMVCEKENNVQIDFENDAISTILNGDYISAKGTTLGADDGFGIALILYALENFNQGFPNIEAVFTTSEETDMSGAENIDCSKLKSIKMIGLDSTRSDEIIVSCAKSIDFTFTKKLTRTTTKIQGYKLIISGLLGGHSGDDIHLNRANANKVLFDFINSLSDAQISTFKGGNKRNAIPREAECIFVSSDKNIENKFESYKQKLQLSHQNEQEYCIKLQEYEVNEVIDDYSNLCVKNMVAEYKNGVLEENESGLPIASINLANIQIDNEINVKSMFRTNKEVFSEKYKFIYSSLASRHDIDCEISNEKGMFERTNGNLATICQETYKKLFNEEAKILDIHAGLEGGVFARKIPNADIVNLGADLYDIHSPKEKMKISSLTKLEKWLSEILLSI